MDSERIYISTLKQGIDDYIAKFDSYQLPDTLTGQRLNIFANIEKIHEIHEKTFLPKLLDCNFDPEKIGETFTTFIKENKFDNYIVYVLNREKSVKLCRENNYYFKQIQKDRLGIGSFLVLPIQRLPRYQLLLGEIIKELTKDLNKNKSAIAACCVAEKSVRRLLNDVDEHCE